jgi:hypothetical protein
MHKVPEEARFFQEETSRLSPFGPLRIKTAVCGSQALTGRIVGIPKTEHL